MSKAKFPDRGRSDAERRDEKRGSGHRKDKLFVEEAPASSTRQEARPIRDALAEIESQLARLSAEDRAGYLKKASSGLDQDLTDIARRLNEDLMQRREVRAESGTGHIAPAGLEPESESRFEELQRAVESVAQSLDSFREGAAERGDQQLVTMRQIENIRREIRDMTQALGELAPRASVVAIETAINDLGQRIDSQRARGVSEEALAPAERIIGELRPVIEDLDPTPIVRNLRADVETIGVRLEKLQAGNAANASAVRDLARETHEIKAQLSALMARPLPLEKIETRIIDVTQRVDALTLSRDVPGAGLGEALKAIRAVLGAEMAKGFDSFNSRLDRLAQKLDAVVEKSAAMRFDELGGRIDALGETLGKKIDSALESGGRASEFEEIGRRFDFLESRITESAPTASLARIEAIIADSNRERQFAEVTQHIDQLREAVAERMEKRAGAGDLAHLAAVEDLLRALDSKIDASLASDARHFDLQAIERELAQLSFKIDRFDDFVFAPRTIGQNFSLDEIVERLDQMQAVFAQRLEDGARAEKRERELAGLVESLAERMSHSAGSAMDAAALKALETQIGALSQRLERIDTGVASGARADETLTAVHQTLKRIVIRLGGSDEELCDMRVAAPETAPRRAKGLEGDTREAVGQSAEGEDRAPVDPLEFLLPAGGDRQEPLLAPPDHAAHRASVQSEFIAAARRAAQPHAADADAEPADAARASGTAQDQEKARGTVVKLGAAIQDRKRPLLLGLGAVMLMIGAYQLARMGGEGGLTFGPSPWRQEAKAPAKAVRPLPSPEMALGPKGAKAPSVTAQSNIDPTPTGTIETPSSGDAFAAIKRLAEEGQPAAQYELGARFAEGRGAPRDAYAAAKWFEKAAERGLAPAQFRLGSLYEKGVGVDRDYARARMWYERAAEAGNARAMHNYAVLLAEGGDGKPDYAAAAEWFRRAAEYGVRDSQFNLAILYARGLGVSRNLQQSYAWFSAAADQGDDDAARKRDEIGARLDSKEFAAAKALAAAFRAKAPEPAANDQPALRPGGAEGAREQAPVKPTPASPSGKPRVS
ncbi:MAG: peptidoglycan-binding protein [Methylocystis sp.]